MANSFPPEQLYQDLVALHGHRCPMSTLGLRLGYALIQPDMGSSVTYRYHSEDCAAEGIRLALKELQPSASFEIVHNRRHLLSAHRADETISALVINRETMAIAWNYRKFREENPEAGDEHNLWLLRETILESTLAKLKSMESAKLFDEAVLEI